MMSQSQPISGGRTARWILSIGSVVSFVASLTQSAFYIAGEDPTAWSPGIGLLLVGWLGLFDGQVAWLANPCLLCSWILVWIRPLRIGALVTAIVSLLFALSFLLYADILREEAGNRAVITHLAIGYWLWVLSSLCAIAASATNWLKARPTSPS